MKKTVWLVNEYNFPDDTKTRQTVLCGLLNHKGYDAYIISGSAENKGDANRLPGKERFRFVETEEAKGYIIQTNDYHHSYERVIVSLQFQRRIWSLRKQLPKPDVIISDFAGLFGNVFLKWKAKYGTRIIYDILDLWPEGFVDMGYIKKGSLIAKYLYSLEHKSYREADGLIFSFSGGKDYIVDKGWSRDTGGDVNTDDIGYLNNGVDLKGVDEQKEDFEFIDPDLQSGKFKVIYLGSISDFNGLDILVDAAKVLQDLKENDIDILIFGYGNQEERLRNRVLEMGLSNIKFKGKLDKRYAMSLLSKSDLNVFTFKDTPLLKYGVSPNKLFMYFAAGKPVLSMIKPAYDLVESKNAGISVENNPEIVANAIIRFRDMDKEEYDTYCKNARATAEEYDYKNLVQVLIDKIEG